MRNEDIDPFFATLKAANPQPNTELEYTNVFELLAAVLLLLIVGFIGLLLLADTLGRPSVPENAVLVLNVSGSLPKPRTIVLSEREKRSAPSELPVGEPQPTNNVAANTPIITTKLLLTTTCR